MDPLAEVLADEKLSAAAKLAFWWLHARRNVGGETFFTARQMGHHLGRTSRAAQRWLEDLAASPHIDVREHSGMLRATFPTTSSSPPPSVATEMASSLTPKVSPYHEEELTLKAGEGAQRPNQRHAHEIMIHDGGDNPGANSGKVDFLAIAEDLSTRLASVEVRVKELADEIFREVGDRQMHPSIARRVAEAVINEGLSLGDLRELIAVVQRKRRAGTLRSPGAYFHSAARKLCAKRDVNWPRPGASNLNSRNSSSGA